ncbi:MAG: HAD hydrolase family protein [Candidatus Latescibacterota bacterium]
MNRRSVRGSPLEGIRLVVLDLDGTLLPASKRLTDRARRVVADLGDAGIAVSLATGKGWNLTDS